MNITLSSGAFEHFTFPGGEEHIRITERPSTSPVNITANLKTSSDVMTLLLLADALKRMFIKVGVLQIPYVPYARQDRVCNEGESLSLSVMASLINSIGAQMVAITDPHSDVTPALINNVHIVEQHEIAPKLPNTVLVCPDNGAEKKIIKYDQPYLRGHKIRDPMTGKITDTWVEYDPELVHGKDLMIVDDICDGGWTFIQLARVLKSEYEAEKIGKIILFVSHGIFSKGFDVFKGFIDEVWWYETGVGLKKEEIFHC